MQSRILFGIVPIFFAYAGLAGVGAVGLGAVVSTIIFAGIICYRRNWSNLSKVFRNKRLLQLSVLFAVLNSATATANVLIPLPTYVALMQLAPLASLAAAPLFGEKPNKKDWLAFPIGAIGVLIILQGSIEQLTLLTGLLIVLIITLLVISIHGFATLGRAQEAPALETVFVLMLAGTPFVLIQPEVFDLQASKLAAIAGAGIFLAVGNILIYKSFINVPAFRSLLLKPLSFLLTTILSIWLLDAAWSWDVVLGGVMIMMASFVIYWSQKKTPEKETLEEFIETSS
jgi:drug/metabolite transporter (DMT)-like permease